MTQLQSNTRMTQSYTSFCAQDELYGNRKLLQLVQYQ